MPDMYDVIQELLNQKDMNKKELANKAGIPYSSLISAFNRRSDSFSSSYLQKIAIALDVSMNEILDYAYDERDNHTRKVIEMLEDMGFSFDYDGYYDLYGNVGLRYDEQGMTTSINRQDLVSLVDSIIADSEEYKDRYIKKRLLFEFSDENQAGRLNSLE